MVSFQKEWERFAVKMSMEQAAVGATAVLEADSSWQHVPPHREELELLREVGDLRFDGCLTRQAFLYKGKSG